MSPQIDPGSLDPVALFAGFFAAALLCILTCIWRAVVDAVRWLEEICDRLPDCEPDEPDPASSLCDPK